MRCTAYCTAASYDLVRLHKELGRQAILSPQRDVLHAPVKEKKRGKGHIFYFSYGTVVFWGFTEEEERGFLTTLKIFERERVSRPEVEEMDYSYGEKTKIDNGEITLESKDIDIKLAISYALSQSAKLTIFEATVQATVNETKMIPKELARKGKISLSRKQISQKMGEIFLERHSVNLHTDMLETPEFFWEHPDIETYYRKAAYYLDIKTRVDVLNRRLTIMHELYEILHTELNHQHSSRLEWTIIILILIEVNLIILKDIFHIF